MDSAIDEKSWSQSYTPSTKKFKPQIQPLRYGLSKTTPRHIHAQLVSVERTDVYVIFRSVNGRQIHLIYTQLKLRSYKIKLKEHVTNGLISYGFVLRREGIIFQGLR